MSLQRQWPKNTEKRLALRRISDLSHMVGAGGRRIVAALFLHYVTRLVHPRPLGLSVPDINHPLRVEDVAAGQRLSVNDFQMKKNKPHGARLGNFLNLCVAGRNKARFVYTN
jgi:hypothetical protein